MDVIYPPKEQIASAFVIEINDDPRDTPTRHPWRMSVSMRMSFDVARRPPLGQSGGRGVRTMGRALHGIGA